MPYILHIAFGFVNPRQVALAPQGQQLQQQFLAILNSIGVGPQGAGISHAKLGRPVAVNSNSVLR